LLGSCLSAVMISVLSYLRSQAHGSTVNELGEGLGVGKSVVISAIKGLREWQLIKQDSRTIRAGLQWDADEAVYYTVPANRGKIDKIRQACETVLDFV